jgi:hypothetical protein
MHYSGKGHCSVVTLFWLFLRDFEHCVCCISQQEIALEYIYLRTRDSIKAVFAYLQTFFFKHKCFAQNLQYPIVVAECGLQVSSRAPRFSSAATRELSASVKLLQAIRTSAELVPTVYTSKPLTCTKHSASFPKAPEQFPASAASAAAAATEQLPGAAIVQPAAASFPAASAGFQLVQPAAAEQFQTAVV